MLVWNKKYVINKLLTRCTIRCLGHKYSTFDPKEMIKKSLEQDITIPAAKKWSPTAILEVMDSLTGPSIAPTYQDLPSPHFQMMPLEKRMAYRSKGLEAAEHIISSYPNLLQDSWDSDEVDLWLRSGQSPTLDESSSEVAESVESQGPVDDIIKALDQNKMMLAAELFIKASKDDIPLALTNRLFAYLAFYRSSPEYHEKMQEEASNFLRKLEATGKVKSRLLHQVFSCIKDPTEDHFNVYLQVLLQIEEFDKAIEVYKDQMLPNNFKANLQTSNKLLSIPKNDWKLFNLVCNEMNKNGILPDQETFSAVIKRFCHKSGDLNDFVERMTKIENEMKVTGVEMSVHLLCCFLKKVLNDKVDRDLKVDHILELLEKLDLKYQSVFDVASFSEIMFLLGGKNDLNRAKRVFRIVTTTTKHKLMKNLYLERRF